MYLKSLNFGSYIPPTTITFFFILTKRNYEMIVCTQQDNSLKKTKRVYIMTCRTVRNQ